MAPRRKRNSKRFNQKNGSVEAKNREAELILRLRMYGTEEQLKQTIEKLKFELELQKFDFDITPIDTESSS